jgi:predicted nucleotidyltransferase
MSHCYLNLYTTRINSIMLISNINSGIPLTSYSDIDTILLYFLKNIQTILADNFFGMYLYGSLATGGFDPKTSDIDFIFVTKQDVSDKEFLLLHELHKYFDSSNSPWAKKIEVAYITSDVFIISDTLNKKYPQIEKEGELIKDKLEIGWVFQQYSLYEHGIVVSGPNPRDFISPISQRSLLYSAHSIATLWNQQAHDKEEVKWLEKRDEQQFVVLTLCRFHYLMCVGVPVSKVIGAKWAMENLSERWMNLIKKAGEKIGFNRTVDKNEINDSIDFIDFTARSLREHNQYL